MNELRSITDEILKRFHKLKNLYVKFWVGSKRAQDRIRIDGHKTYRFQVYIHSKLYFKLLLQCCTARFHLKSKKKNPSQNLQNIRKLQHQYFPPQLSSMAIDSSRTLKKKHQYFTSLLCQTSPKTNANFSKTTCFKWHKIAVIALRSKSFKKHTCTSTGERLNIPLLSVADICKCWNITIRTSLDLHKNSWRYRLPGR